MKYVVALCLLAAVAMAFPTEFTVKYIPILERTEVHDPNGEFTLRYVTGDGITVSETGVLKPTRDGKDRVLVKEGTSEYTAPTGELIRTSYIADELGYRATGDHLPKSVVA